MAFGGGFGASAQKTVFGTPAPAQPTAFGTPAPANTAFGTPAQSTGLFGNPNPQPAQGGLFGTPAAASAPAATSAFGIPAKTAFGTGQPQNAGGLFGTPANSNNSSSVFGSTVTAANSAGSFFGAPSNAASTGTGLFGGSPQTSTFGTTPTQPAGSAMFGSAPASTILASSGTTSVRYQVTTEAGASNNSEKYASISIMSQYRTKAVEELRLEDYGAGVKSKSQVPGAAGVFSGGAQTPAFGTQPAPAGLFANPASTSAFGAPQAAPPSLFGTQPPAATPFGQPAAAPSAGIFGTTQTNPTSIFGSQPQQQQSQPSLFGTPQSQPAAGTSLFGGTQSQVSPFAAPKPAQPTNIFTAPKPATFGTTPSTGTPAFGVAPAPTGSIFGTQTQQQPPTLAGGFSAPAPTTSIFTQSAAGQPTQPGFAQPSNPKSFGIQAPGSGLFATNTATKPEAGPTTVGGLGVSAGGFNGTGTGLFSAPTANPVQNVAAIGTPGLGLATNQGATTGLFNSNGGGLGTAQPTMNFGFSAPSSAPRAGAFDASGAAQFPANQQLQAGIAANPYGNQPLFNSTPVPGGPGLVGGAPGGIGQPGAIGLSPAPLGGRGTPASPAVSSSPLYRRTARSVPRVRPRGTHRRLAGVGNGTNTSSLFEVSSPAPGFSPEQFLARTGIDKSVGGVFGEPISTKGRASAPKPANSVKTLVIQDGPAPTRDAPVGEHSQTPVEPNRDEDTPKSPARTPSADFTPNTDARPATPGRGLAGYESRGSDARPSSDSPSLDSSVVKPTPRRMAAQFLPDGQSPAAHSTGSDRSRVYTTYREFYNDQIYPVDTVEPTTPTDHRSFLGPRTPPILTKAGYYTKPPMATLKMLKMEALDAVEDFTIGRKDVGEITWIGPTSVTGLNLDTIVQIEPREVVVYLDGEAKPQEGEALNKPAVVTLHGIWRRSKKTGKPAMEGSAVVKFVEKLRAQCDADETQFLEYEATRGTWRFQVRHFSRYGFDSSDDDESENDMGNANHPASGATEQQYSDRSPKISGIAAPSPWSDDEEANNSVMDNNPASLKDRDSIDGNQSTADEDMVTSGTRFMATEPLLRSLEAPRLQSIRNCVFTEERPTSPMETGIGPMETEIIPVEQRGANPYGQAWTRSVKSRTLAPMAPMTDPASLPMRPVPRHSAFDESIQAESGLGWGATRCAWDAGLRMGRVFRISFGPEGQLVRPTKPAFEGTCYLVEECVLYFANNKSSLESKLQLHYKASQTTLANDEAINMKVPTSPNLEAHFGVDNENIIESYCEVSEDDEDRYATVVFRLLNALYGQGATSRSVREQVSDWLKDVACDWSQDDPCKGKGNLDEVFGLLSGGKVDSASLALMNLGEVRMASIVSQAMSTGISMFRNDCKNQLEECRYAKDSEDFWERRKDILELLAGEVTKVSGVLSLSWYRAFGLHYWYGWQSDGTSDDSSEIGAAIGSYALDWKEQVSETFEFGCYPPLAYHRSRLGSACKPLALVCQRELIHDLPEAIDMNYQLLRLFGGADEQFVLEHALSPSSYTSDMLDHELGWHVFALLRGLVPAAAAIATPERIHCAFAAQLESAGLCLWSIYVLSCCPVSTSGRSALLQETLCRVWPRARREKVTLEEGVPGIEAEEFLISVLSFPKSWICRAKAIWAHYSKKNGEEVANLLELGVALKKEKASAEEVKAVYGGVHNLTCDELVPRIITLRSSCPDRIWVAPALKAVTVLQTLETHHIKDYGIAQWDVRGGVLLQCIKLLVLPQTPESLYDMAKVHGLVERVQAFSRLSILSDAELDGVRSVRLGDKASGLHEMRALCASVVSSVVVFEQRKALVRLGEAVGDEEYKEAVEDLKKTNTASGVKNQLAKEYSGDFMDNAGQCRFMERRWALPDSCYTV